MNISLTTIEASNYKLEIDAKVQDGFQNLTPATGGGRCADGTYVRNYYGTDALGQTIRFEIDTDKETEEKIEYMVRNYSEFNLSFQSKIMKVGFDFVEFGTGNDNVLSFVVLEEY